MLDSHETFIAAIHGRKKVRILYFSKKDSAPALRLCAPMDYGPSNRVKHNMDLYHFWDYEGSRGPHSTSKLLNEIQRVELTQADFDPADFVTWSPNWWVQRDWGEFS